MALIGDDGRARRAAEFHFPGFLQFRRNRAVENAAAAAAAPVSWPLGFRCLTAGQSSTLSNNQIAMMVSPAAALLSHTLNYAAGAGGTLTGSTSQMVTHGGSGTAVTAVPNTGFEFVDWSDGVLTASRTDTNVMATLSVTANFAIASHYLVWISGFPSLTGADRDPTANPDKDILINLFEYAFNLDPTVSETTIVAAGTGTAGMPLIEVRSFGPAERLVIEYIRRIDVTDLVYTPQFGADLTAGGWGPGTNETVTPIDGSFERVVIEDTVNAAPGSIRFGRLVVELASLLQAFHHAHVWDVSLEKLVAMGGEAEAFVETNRVGLGMEIDLVETVLDGVRDEKFREPGADAAAAVFFEDGDAPDVACRVEARRAERCDTGIAFDAGKSVEALRVAAVDIQFLGDFLLDAEHFPADLSKRLAVGFPVGEADDDRVHAVLRKVIRLISGGQLTRTW